MKTETLKWYLSRSSLSLILVLAVFACDTFNQSRQYLEQVKIGDIAMHDIIVKEETTLKLDNNMEIKVLKGRVICRRGDLIDHFLFEIIQQLNAKNTLRLD